MRSLIFKKRNQETTDNPSADALDNLGYVPPEGYTYNVVFWIAVAAFLLALLSHSIPWVGAIVGALAIILLRACKVPRTYLRAPRATVALSALAIALSAALSVYNPQPGAVRLSIDAPSWRQSYGSVLVNIDGTTDAGEVVHESVSYDSVISYPEVSGLKNGYNFGSLKECLEEPNKYFCITFDDGFAEHIDIAKKIIDKYNAKKESLIFSINVGNSIYNKYTGMDIIYELIENGKIDEIFDFFDVEKSGNIYDDIKIIKKRYIKESPNILLDFYNYFSKECCIDNLFLNERQLKELSKIATIASHSIYHRDMTNFVELSKEEMLNSKNELEKLIDEEVYIFNYVEGKNNAQLQNECKTIGYKYALSIKNEINNDFSIGRKDISKF